MARRKKRTERRNDFKNQSMKSRTEPDLCVWLKEDKARGCEGVAGWFDFVVILVDEEWLSCLCYFAATKDERKKERGGVRLFCLRKKGALSLFVGWRGPKGVGS